MRLRMCGQCLRECVTNANFCMMFSTCACREQINVEVGCMLTCVKEPTHDVYALHIIPQPNQTQQESTNKGFFINIPTEKRHDKPAVTCTCLPSVCAWPAGRAAMCAATDRLPAPAHSESKQHNHASQLLGTPLRAARAPATVAPLVWDAASLAHASCVHSALLGDCPNH